MNIQLKFNKANKLIIIILIYIFGGLVWNFLNNICFSFIYGKFDKQYISIVILSTIIPIIITCGVNYVCLLFVLNKNDAYFNFNAQNLSNFKETIIIALIIITLITIGYDIYKYELNISTIITFATFSPNNNNKNEINNMIENYRQIYFYSTIISNTISAIFIILLIPISFKKVNMLLIKK